tara:strand:- start:449 stop:718 length:270 start_codon:yes stop_codon:yes gene_type:complete
MTVSFAVVASVLQETVGEVSTEQKEKLEHKRRMRENRKKERKKERETYFDVDASKAFTNGASGFIGSKNAFAWGRNGTGCCHKLGDVVG